MVVFGCRGFGKAVGELCSILSLVKCEASNTRFNPHLYPQLKMRELALHSHIQGDSAND